MEAELMTLASSGASALVKLMITDGWATAKESFARLLGQQHGDQQAVAEELEDARAQLLEAGDQDAGELAADVAAEWRVRLRRLLQADPEVASLLAELIERYESETTRSTASAMIHRNTFQGPTALHTGSGDQINTFNTPAS